MPRPLGCTGLSWGLDYGGRVIIHGPKERYPWEDCWDDRDYAEPDPIMCTDPFNVPQSRELMEEAHGTVLHAPSTMTDHTPGGEGATAEAAAVSGNSVLPLPPELCLYIATLLPTVDALNARLASRSFSSFFYDPLFWASRFRMDAERSWFLEARHERSCNWTLLYHRTRHSNLGNGLRNRKRIWLTIRLLVDIVALRKTPETFPRVALPWAVVPNLPFPAITGDLFEGGYSASRTFSHGCRLMYSAKSVIPDSPTCHLKVYFVTLGDAKYICGLRFTFNTGQDYQLGYESMDSQTEYVRRIQGFVIAPCARGIKALQCVDAKGTTSPWLGDARESSRTHRLKSLGEIEELQTGFDVSC